HPCVGHLRELGLRLCEERGLAVPGVASEAAGRRPQRRWNVRGHRPGVRVARHSGAAGRDRAVLCRDLSWWLDKIDTYKTVAGCINGYQGGFVYFNVALRILANKGPKYNVLSMPAVVVDNTNLKVYARK